MLYTDRGVKWLSQFDHEDRENASKLVTGLTLISHNEFERNLLTLIEIEVNAVKGKVALFAVREVEKDISFFKQAMTLTNNGPTLDSLNRGNDHGSEARVASMIRNFCKQSSGKALNHPSLEEIKAEKCNEIIFIDDFIGSGQRVLDYLASFWSERTIVSWVSFKYLKFRVISYSGIEEGVKNIEKHKSNPVISFYRSCPTIDLMPWVKVKRDAVIEL
ncbi:hypothetical protein HGB07_10100, partial [Candidatus Roizmanbacteria bacterium]|nr:hypothetical protein [Candidatus Roizmanbacteria bacterium]